MPTPSAPGALIPAYSDQQCGGPVPEWYVRQPSGDRSTRDPVSPTVLAPGIWFSNPALDHRPPRVQMLADRYQAELVQTAEHPQDHRLRR